MISKRKMMYISTHLNGANFLLRFELEDYYRRRDRAIVAEQELKDFDADRLAADPLFYERMIGYIMIGIGCEIDGLINNERYPCQILYPFFREEKDVLRLDREMYAYNTGRTLCIDLPFQYTAVKNFVDDEVLKSKIGRIICKYLPLGPFPHDLDETAPSVKIELDRFKPFFYDGWMDGR